jgi:hypothetical protein|nr:MAG TPA: hypothetical protein [Caudoviricetes sp.]DAX70799.1 MAG TPA: hypothetical protein [Caudoviricetes sp.]
MKYTVIYKDSGDVLAVVSEQPGIKSIKIGTFEIPDNHIIDSIDVSGKEPTVVSHATGMISAEELEKQAKAIDMLEKTVMELTSLVMSDEAAKDNGEQ